MVSDSPGPAGEPVRDAILEWDGVMAAGSAGAAAFAAWRNALTTGLRRAGFEALRDDPVYGPLFAPYLDSRRASDWGSSRSEHAKPFGIDIHRLATAAPWRTPRGHPDAWGDTHVFGPTHAFDLADADLWRRPCRPRRCPATSTRCAAPAGSRASPTRPTAARRHATCGTSTTAAGSGWVVPMGASGDPRSPHHVDQLAAWAEARLLPVELDWDRLTLED